MLFEKQDFEYKNKILDKSAIKVSIEALSTFGWHKYSDYQVGIDTFGRSAPGKNVYEFFEFTPEILAKKILEFKK